MDLVKNLPNELQNKVFYYIAEHPVASLMKRQFQCQYLCGEDVSENQFIRCLICKTVVCHKCCPYTSCDDGKEDYKCKVACLNCFLFRHSDCCMLESQGWTFGSLWYHVFMELSLLNQHGRLVQKCNDIATIEAPENRAELEKLFKKWMKREYEVTMKQLHILKGTMA